MRSEYIVPIGPDGIYEIKTGTWRTTDPRIDQDVCIRCGVCLMHCPVGAVKREEGRFTIDLEYCKGCGICAHECPKGAITMEGRLSA